MLIRRWCIQRCGLWIFLLIWLLAACGGTGTYVLEPKPSLHREPQRPLYLPPTITILIDENKNKIFNNEMLLKQAYDRLESQSWKILTQRARVEVIERRNLDLLRHEQHLQYSYGMDEQSAVRLGQLIGAQAVLIYQIQLPSWRDRFLADDDELLPLSLGGRILNVETGTVLWSHTVMVSSAGCQSNCWFAGKPRATLWPVLERGIDQLVAQLAKVVPCHNGC